MATVEGVLKISDGVLSDHSGSVEALCPGDQGSSVDGGLEDGEREGESELKLSVSTDCDLVLIHYYKSNGQCQ